MIYDRTASDIESAKQIISEKVKKFISLTDNEFKTLEKGCVTIDTLNRIENAQKDLVHSIKEMRYSVLGVLNKEWTFQDIFDEKELSRITNNLTQIKDAFFVYNATPATPTPKYHFENFNAIEKIILDILTMIEDVKSNYRECGNFECGEDNNE